MDLVAPVTGLDEFAAVVGAGPDLVELRLDLVSREDHPALAAACREVSVPLIATVRSVGEGGGFAGDTDDCARVLAPFLPLARYVDLERRFRSLAPSCREAGCRVIASVHLETMLPLPELFGLARDLRSWGDLPKIVLAPSSDDDLLDLLSFTHAVEKPVCTSIMGTAFRHGRALLPLFGSSFAYCSVGRPSSPGQYTLAEMRTLATLLGPVETAR
ncbi:MAG TPA: type I 3-dehydroquinate dehydratase [Methanoregulaceae archaeon]|nr:type I 3-dehydroquinate dehydratase [Methanoregulaceae archaeon]HOV68673.1 type I 3-dehydroquinate dehydratase [Methanoregulaceae archaeon]HQJ87430.1 type I 3-dehydroquinate dehydratase [Methanoregulaceae archaeon]